LNFDDMIGRELVLKGVWEEQETRTIQTLAPKCRVFLDVGANIGYFSMLAASLMPPGGRVFAFEPNPEMVDLARRGFSKGSFDSIQLIPAAAGDRNCTVQLHLNKGANRGKTSLYEANTNRGGVIDVECRRLDDFIESTGITSLDLIKMDVEGHEWFALKGAMETLKSYRPALLLELAPVLLAQAGHTAEDVVDLLAPLGYEIQRHWHPDNYLLVAKGTPPADWLPSLVEVAKS
jgi:FkbM family methyltransferase